MEDTESITSGDIAAEFKAQSAAASPAPATQDTPDKAPAPAIEAPVVSETSEDRYKGWIPPDAHKRVVDGFHDRLDKSAWAHGLDRAEVEEAMTLRRQVLTRQSREAAPEAPQPDTKDERGEPFYSPAQAAKLARFEAQQAALDVRKEFEERFGPMESEFTQGRQMAALDAQISQAEQWSGFTENLTEILAVITDANDRRERGERVPKVSLQDAYIRIVAPKLATRSAEDKANDKKAWLAELNSTTERVQDDVKPGRAPAASRKTGDYTFSEAFKEVLATK